MPWAMALLGLPGMLAFAAPSFGHARAPAQPLVAGVAVIDITPPVPFRMSGYFTERLSTGRRDALQAKAIVFRQGAVAAALVFCDLVAVPADITGQARRAAGSRVGIPVEHIAVAATHTHTGPLYFGALHDHFHQRALAQGGSDPHDSAEYRTLLVDRIATAIIEADRACAPVALRTGTVTEDRLSFNRRYHMKDGSVRFNPGVLNPDIVRPAGPSDPEVGVVVLSPPENGRPSAAIVVYALHLDTLGGTEYSADFPGVVEARLRRSFGDGFTLLFGAGTCGDINHIDVTRPTRRTTDDIGALLGDAVEQAIRQPHALDAAEPSLAVRSTTLELALQRFSDDRIAEARHTMPRIGSRELSFLEAVEATKVVGTTRWPGDTAMVEVQAFRLDRDTAIVTLPSEVFVELGLAIKAASPFRTTLVVELTNDALAYIPTKKAFVEGGYEVVNSFVQPGAGEQLVEAALGLLEELR